MLLLSHCVCSESAVEQWVGMFQGALMIAHLELHMERRRVSLHVIICEVVEHVVCLLGLAPPISPTEDEVNPAVQVRRDVRALQSLCQLLGKVLRVYCPGRKLQISNLLAYIVVHDVSKSHASFALLRQDSVSSAKTRLV